MNAAEQSIRSTSLAPPLGRAGGSRTSVARKRTSSVATGLALLDALRGGSVGVSLPGGARRQLGEGRCVAEWTIHDEQVLARILAEGDIALGETYAEGLWDSDAPARLLTLFARNRGALSRAVYGRMLGILGHRLRHLLRANTRAGSRRNIAAHYDLGNDFYALWLDRTMSYSSAIFAARTESLVEAQLRKYRRVLERLAPRPGQTILEIGCGWGAFAEIAATEFDCRVLGLTLSREQLAFARRRSLRGGFAGQVAFELCDYRDVRGDYDHVVSIEMLEAVGERFWPVWFRQVAERLRRGGKAVVQSITIDEALFGRYRRGTDFIQRHIFPGGMLPTPQRFERHAGRAGLQLAGDFAFGRDYATTLARWREAFDRHEAAVAERGFDEHFRRLWRFYLAYCEAGFLAGDIDVHQFELEHRR